MAVRAGQYDSTQPSLCAQITALPGKKIAMSILLVGQNKGETHHVRFAKKGMY